MTINNKLFNSGVDWSNNQLYFDGNEINVGKSKLSKHEHKEAIKKLSSVLNNLQTSKLIISKLNPTQIKQLQTNLDKLKQMGDKTEQELVSSCIARVQETQSKLKDSTEKKEIESA